MDQGGCQVAKKYLEQKRSELQGFGVELNAELQKNSGHIQALDAILADFDAPVPTIVRPAISGRAPLLLWAGDCGSSGVPNGSLSPSEPAVAPDSLNVPLWMDLGLYDASESYATLAATVARCKDGLVRVTEVQRVAVMIGKSTGAEKNLWTVVEHRLRGHKDFEKLEGGLYRWTLFDDQAHAAAA